MTTNTNRRVGDPAARKTDLADGSITSKVIATRPKVQGGAHHRRNNTDPLIVLPWRVWARLTERVRQ
jgi:hypothetical protein